MIGCGISIVMKSSDMNVCWPPERDLLARERRVNTRDSLKVLTNIRTAHSWAVYYKYGLWLNTHIHKHNPRSGSSSVSVCVRRLKQITCNESCLPRTSLCPLFPKQIFNKCLRAAPWHHNREQIGRASGLAAHCESRQEPWNSSSPSLIAEPLNTACM